MLNLYLKCGMGENNQICSQKSLDECMVKSFQDHFNVTLMKKREIWHFYIEYKSTPGM